MEYSGALFELLASDVQRTQRPGIAWHLAYTSTEGRFSTTSEGFVAGLYTFSDENKAIAFESNVTFRHKYPMCITRNGNQVCVHLIQPQNGVLTYHLSLRPSSDPEVDVMINILWYNNTWKSGIILASAFETKLFDSATYKIYKTPVCIYGHERVIPIEIKDRRLPYAVDNTIKKIPRALYLEPGCSVEWRASGTLRTHITGEAATWLCRIGICVLPSWLFQCRLSSEKITFNREGIKSLEQISSWAIGNKPISTDVSSNILRQLNRNSCQCRQRILAWVVPGIPQDSASSSEYEKFT